MVRANEPSHARIGTAQRTPLYKPRLCDPATELCDGQRKTLSFSIRRGAGVFFFCVGYNHCMKRSSLLYALIPLSILLAGGHYFGGVFGFYLDFPFFDLVMHFGAGIICAFSILYVLDVVRVSGALVMSRMRVVLFAVVGALLIGVAWEAFEYVYDITFASNYLTDTASDVAMDLLGAFVASLYALRKGYVTSASNAAISHG